jgi:hypothetical protein
MLRERVKHYLFCVLAHLASNLLAYQEVNAFTRGKLALAGRSFDSRQLSW